jgi:hypothetical protein
VLASEPAARAGDQCDLAVQKRHGGSSSKGRAS